MKFILEKSKDEVILCYSMILQRVEPFLGNGLVTHSCGNGYTCNNRGTAGHGVFY
jgi:hypothetical protein